MELHEGCGRTKLFWLLAVADARTLKALVEYREGGARHKGVGTSGQCRFCGAVGSSGLLAIGNVCADQECQVCEQYLYKIFILSEILMICKRFASRIILISNT